MSCQNIVLLVDLIVECLRVPCSSEHLIECQSEHRFWCIWLQMLPEYCHSVHFIDVQPQHVLYRIWQKSVLYHYARYIDYHKGWLIDHGSKMIDSYQTQGYYHWYILYQSGDKSIVHYWLNCKTNTVIIS